MLRAAALAVLVLLAPEARAAITSMVNFSTSTLPGGVTSNIQYNNNLIFEGLPGSSVSGSTMTVHRLRAADVLATYGVSGTTGTFSSTVTASAFVGTIPPSSLDFSTITAAIATKVSKTGDSMTGQLLMSGSSVTLSGGAFINTSTGQSNPAHSEGRVFYDNSQKTLAYYNEEPAVTMSLGQENWVRVLNQTGSTLTDGQAVRITGASGGGLPTVMLAVASSSTTAQVAGIVTHSIENNTTGYITAFGRVSDLNTAALTPGNKIYLASATSGAFTDVKPLAPNFLTPLGTVLVAHASQGVILVQVEATQVETFVSSTTRYSVAQNINSTSDIDVATVTVSLRGGRPIMVLFTAEVNNTSGANRDYTYTIKVDGTDLSLDYTNNTTTGNSGSGTRSVFVDAGLSAGSHTFTGTIRSSAATATQTAEDRELSVVEY